MSITFSAGVEAPFKALAESELYAFVSTEEARDITRIISKLDDANARIYHYEAEDGYEPFAADVPAAKALQMVAPPAKINAEALALIERAAAAQACFAIVTVYGQTHPMAVKLMNKWADEPEFNMSNSNALNLLQRYGIIPSDTSERYVGKADVDAVLAALTPERIATQCMLAMLEGGADGETYMKQRSKQLLELAQFAKARGSAYIFWG